MRITMASLKFFLLSVLCLCCYVFANAGVTKNETNKDHLAYYGDILEAQKNKSVLIIDIRGDYEILQTGKLPGSIHIPMAQVANALTKTLSEEFEKRYGRKQPTRDSNIILSCQSGYRSAKLLLEMLKLGYYNTYSYAGGWEDWEYHQKY